MRLPSVKSITQSADQRKQMLYRRILQEEAKIGGEIFGAVAVNGRREFFCLDERTWIWHEEWIGQDNQPHAVTTRYDVRPTGVIKSQDNQPHRELTREEAKNFIDAVQIYSKRVLGELYADPA